ncbi:MAG TPA: DUF2934 domain-containing protein [Bryobacteraceae bacterium]|nr:DUF2934 domain-containing protein [Bryobacteraceae bacterium]
MPKRKTVEADTAPAAEKTKRARTATPKAPAATHKRTTKKTIESANTSDGVVAAAPIASVAISHDEVARLAYSYFEARGYADADPLEDWLRAERELLEFAQNR